MLDVRMENQKDMAHQKHLKNVKKARKPLGFEHKEKAKKENGWNKNNCEMEYSKCIWRKEEPTIQSNPGWCC